MVSRARTTNKKKRPTGKRKASQKKTTQARLVILGLVFFGIFGYALYRLFTPGHTTRPSLPIFETYPSQDIETETKQIDRCIRDAPEKEPMASPLSRLPKVAIIIDDLGYNEEVASKFLALDGVMSFSVLPCSPFHKSIAASIHQSGRDVLLHLPMEPIEYPQIDPGGGALLSSMMPDDLLDQLRKNLDAVPFAVGVNNHMGSRLTQDPAKMRQIFTILKKRDLFFVDSLTTPRSCCQEAARLLKVRFAKRQVFLDHVQDPSAIRFQIKRLLSIAREHGKAIGIGHPYPITWEVLNEELRHIKNEVELVRVSELVG